MDGEIVNNFKDSFIIECSGLTKDGNFLFILNSVPILKILSNDNKIGLAIFLTCLNLGVHNMRLFPKISTSTLGFHIPKDFYPKQIQITIFELLHLKWDEVFFNKLNFIFFFVSSRNSSKSRFK